jgi:hypothetical protein
MIGKILGIVVCVLVIISTIMMGVYINYEYEKQIGSHMDNARDCLTPDCMLTELNSAKQAMINEGLKDDDYGAIIFKKSSNSMKFQYQHLDSIIERVQSVKEWEVKSQEQGNFEGMKDVYNEKMNNLRLYIHTEGERSDWIADDTWKIKNYLWFEILGVIVCLISIIGIVILNIFAYLESERGYTY